MVSLAFTKTLLKQIRCQLLAVGKFVCAKGCELTLVGHERQPVSKSDSRGKDHGGQMMNGGRKVCPFTDGHITEANEGCNRKLEREGLKHKD
jgi:hypothetical protein